MQCAAMLGPAAALCLATSPVAHGSAQLAVLFITLGMVRRRARARVFLAFVCGGRKGRVLHLMGAVHHARHGGAPRALAFAHPSS